jgi:putative hydrolase of the HAD superfamily
MTKLEAVFFDLGDTLVDLGEGRESYEERLVVRVNKVYDVLAAAGKSLPDRKLFCDALATGSEARYQRALAEQQGLDIYAVLRWFFDLMGISADDGLLEASAEAYCRGSTAAAPLRLGAREVLAQLHTRGLRLGVISNTLQPGRYLDEALTRRGLLDYFVARLYSSELGVAKPHPAIFRAALAALDVAPERALHVGDRLKADVAGARGVGMKAVLIEVAHRPEQDPVIVPDARIAELPELVDVLSWLF